MTPLIALLLVIAALAAVMLLRYQRRRLEAARPAAPEERHLFNLRIGDLVQARGRDWVVEDRLLYEQAGGFQWLEYRLQDGADSRWLSVCEDDELELAWLRRADLAELADAHGLRASVPEHLRWAGRDYRRTERGAATLRADARVMNRRVGVCTYADYQALVGPGEPDGLLSVEWWGGGGDPAGEIELTVGDRIEPGELSLLPGDGRSVYREG
ncbi:MAG: DUF4178 domain-containing protein [Cyanobium sp.]